MKPHRPSPALIVAIIALIVALGGTAVATQRLLITSSHQIKNGVISGKDLRSGTLTGRQLSHHLLETIVAGGGSGSGAAAASTGASEAHRTSGPELPKGGEATIATLDLQPGVYVVLAKTNLTPNLSQDLLQTLSSDPNKTVTGTCTLDAEGTGDLVSGDLASNGTQHVVTLNAQVTRTIDAPGKATLKCKVDQIDWHASDTSIIAIKVGSSTRQEVTG